MHEEAVLRLRAALAEVWASHGRRFLTIEDADDDSRFVQYLDGQLNVAWPFDDEPEELLERLGIRLSAASFVLAWTPGGTAILAVGDLLQEDVAALLEEIVDEALECGDVHVRVDSDR